MLSKEIFEKFVGGEPIPEGARIAPPADIEQEKQALKNLVFHRQWDVFDTARGADFSIGDDYFIALTCEFDDEGLDLLALESDGTISPSEIPGSVYLYLCSRLNLQLTKNNPQDIENEILSPATSNIEGVTGVSLDAIRSFLEPLTVFSVNPNSVFTNTTPGEYKSYYIATFLPKFRSHCLSTRSTDLARSLFLELRQDFIEDNIFFALACSTPKHAFLEVYRSLEFVFVLPRAYSLMNKLSELGHNVGLRVMDFAKQCYLELGWKRVERDSIERLLLEYSRACPDVFINLCNNCQPLFSPQSFSNATEKDLKDSVKAIAGTYYEIRNQVAHQFWPDLEKNISNREWEALIEFTLECLCHYYSSQPLR